jgi:hypothetical protein
MIESHRKSGGMQPCFWFFILLFASFSYAADAPPALVVGESGAHLYARQDDQSEIIARLEKGEALIPLGQAVGVGHWYMVETQKGAVGWVRSSDVRAGGRVEKILKEARSSTWSAATSSGRSFEGTWSAEADPASGAASGTWTLSDGKGAVAMSGTWSASKSPKGWSGSWRARAVGRSAEYSGTWSANLRHKPDARFADLFEAAVREAVGGGWRTGGYSGRWSIRAAE